MDEHLLEQESVEGNTISVEADKVYAVEAGVHHR